MNIKNKVNLDTFWDTLLKENQSNTHSTHSKDGKRTRTPFKILSPTMGRSIMESYEGYSNRIGNSKYHN